MGFVILKQFRPLFVVFFLYFSYSWGNLVKHEMMHKHVSSITVEFYSKNVESMVNVSFWWQSDRKVKSCHLAATLKNHTGRNPSETKHRDQFRHPQRQKIDQHAMQTQRLFWTILTVCSFHTPALTITNTPHPHVSHVARLISCISKRTSTTKHQNTKHTERRQSYKEAATPWNNGNEEI